MRLIDADALLKGKQDHEMISTHIVWNAPTVDAEPIVRCKDCKHRFLEIIKGEKVFSCLYRMGTLDLNGYCDCGAKMDEVWNETNTKRRR